MLNWIESEEIFTEIENKNGERTGEEDVCSSQGPAHRILFHIHLRKRKRGIIPDPPLRKRRIPVPMLGRKAAPACRLADRARRVAEQRAGEVEARERENKMDMHRITLEVARRDFEDIAELIREDKQLIGTLCHPATDQARNSLLSSLSQNLRSALLLSLSVLKYY